MFKLAEMIVAAVQPVREVASMIGHQILLHGFLVAPMGRRTYVGETEHPKYVFSCVSSYHV